jgi:hypothetical protein
MKRKYSSIVGIFVALVLIASLVLPTSVTMPASAASAESRMQWWPVETPDLPQQVTGSLFSPLSTGTPGTETGSELVKLLVGVNGTSMYVMYVREPGSGSSTSKVRFYNSGNGGRTWVGAAYAGLSETLTGNNGDVIVWDMAIAPDNANIIIAAVSLVTTPTVQKVFISNDGGSNWEDTQWPPGGVATLPAGAYISTLDISMDYGGRDILVGIRNGGTGGNAPNNLWTMKMPGYSGWLDQNIVTGGALNSNPFAGDVIAAKFSPTYNGDSTIAVLYSRIAGVVGTYPGTWLVTGVHDIAKNYTAWNATPGIEIKNTTSNSGESPYSTEIISGMIQMPSDFSGQSASLRRIYVSTDAVNRGVTPVKPDRGVYRIDDTTVYTLMDNTNTFKLVTDGQSNRRAASIAYWGTYASGKLMVGERLGQACTASVPVWFTDSPTVCPIPCWYPAKKPPTGAAGQTDCKNYTQGYGNAYVVWSPTFAGQGVAYAVTGSSSYDGPYAAIEVQTHGHSWPAGIFNIMPLDESALSLTRNNGETWNQLSLIDTRMNKLTDVAPSMDCTTVYLASVNNGVRCQGFDSVWRSSTNEKVVAPPLPALPIGQVWERVRTSPTAKSCNVSQSNYAILRLAPDKLDGQIVGWAAGGTSELQYIGGFPVNTSTVVDGLKLTDGSTKAMAWSPDFGDYWADINPRIKVQDFAFESSTILYVLATDSAVQKMPYTGTAWASSTLSVDTGGQSGHTIEAMAPDKVLVGQGIGTGNTNVVTYSSDGGMNFPGKMAIPPSTPFSVGYHVIFDTDFTKNATVYLASDYGFSGIGSSAPSGGAYPTDTSTAGAADTAVPYGLVFRNKVPAGANSNWTSMMTGALWIGYAGPHSGYYGIVQSNSKNVTGQGTLYAAHTIQSVPFTDLTQQAALAARKLMFSGVERTLSPLDGIPKPGLEWTCMDASINMFQPRHPLFTLEPKSLKICGCLTQDTDATLYAIDNDMYSNNQNFSAKRYDRWGDAIARRTTGLLWEYTDCVAKKGPKLILDDGAIIGCDPASGRNQEVNFRWEQLCIATIYQLQIAKDKAFTLQVFDTGKPYGVTGQGLMPADVTAPAYVFFSAGNGSMPGLPTTLITQADTSVKFVTPELECGHGYFWRVRVLDEVTRDAVISPWSDARSFTIKAGFRVTTPYYGPQLLAPDNGCGCACNAPIAFSWSPFKETIEYQFVLSENADLSSPLVNAAVKTTAYQFTGTAKCNKTYFWRVMATKPAPSEWSAVFSFNTQPEPPKPPAPPPEPGTPMWVWVIIAIGAILVIVTLVLIFKTRRV